MRDWRPGDPSEAVAFTLVQGTDGEDLDQDCDCGGGQEGWFNRSLGNDSRGAQILQNKKKSPDTERRELRRM